MVPNTAQPREVLCLVPEVPPSDRIGRSTAALSPEFLNHWVGVSPHPQNYFGGRNWCLCEHPNSSHLPILKTVSCPRASCQWQVLCGMSSVTCPLWHVLCGKSSVASPTRQIPSHPFSGSCTSVARYRGDGIFALPFSVSVWGAEGAGCFSEEKDC